MHIKQKSQGTETTDIANSAVDNDNLALNAYAVSNTSEANLVQAESFTLHGILEALPLQQLLDQT